MINKRVMDIKDCYWIQLIIHELKVADTIGALGCVIHCGKYTSNSPESGLKNMKLALDYVIETIKELNIKSKIILETSCGQGTELIFDYQEFLNFYNSFNEDQKNYFKICIDTCHVWASGFELAEVYNLTKINGNLKDIMVIHVNNSKNPKNSHVDRHDMITQGHMDIKDIIKFLKLIRKNNRNLIFILETPDESNLKEEFKIIK